MGLFYGDLMKWFKHYANAYTNPMISEMIASQGLDFAMRYWLLLELLCEEFKDDTVLFKVSTSTIKSRIHIKHDKKLESFTRVLSEISANFDGNSLEIQKLSNNFWEIKTSIILELMGRDFKKARPDREQPALRRRKKKENKKKNKNKIKAAANYFSILDLDAELNDWLGSVTERTATKILDEYNSDFLKEEIDAAYTWEVSQTPRKKNIGSFLSGWLKRSKNPDKLKLSGLDAFFKSQLPPEVWENTKVTNG